MKAEIEDLQNAAYHAPGTQAWPELAAMEEFVPAN